MQKPDLDLSGLEAGMFDVNTDNGDGIIAIAGTLDFTTAQAALSAVNEQLQSVTGTAVVDMSGVTSSNSAGLALMIEWLAEAQRNNQEIQFKNIPDSLRQISTVCQVDSLI